MVCSWPPALTTSLWSLDWRLLLYLATLQALPQSPPCVANNCQQGVIVYFLHHWRDLDHRLFSLVGREFDCKIGLSDGRAAQTSPDLP